MIKKLEVLKLIASEFNKNNIRYAVGGSVLLYFKGIVDEFNDIDILIDVSDSNRVVKILSDLKATDHTTNNKRKYKTKTFREYYLDDVDIDIIGGMIITCDGIDHDCSLDLNSIDDYCDLGGIKIPLDSLDNWRKYYSLIGGRVHKVDLIDEYNKRHSL